jgi:hypothetical protein
MSVKSISPVTPRRHCVNFNEKVGICNFSPHFRTSATVVDTPILAEVQTIRSCGYTVHTVADIQNWTSALPQLSGLSNKIEEVTNFITDKVVDI